MVKRESWGSRVGFIFAVAGSAIGLGNIWRFPYVAGANGGAAFIALYLICLLVIGFPVLISEILIGRSTQKAPKGAFLALGGSTPWAWGGAMTIITGFIVSAFYSAVAGWIFGYLIEALRGTLTHLHDHAQANQHYESLVGNPIWSVGFHGLFILLSGSLLYFGVRKGIERGNKVMMPLLFFILICLVIRGLMLPHASEALHFLFAPDWKALTPAALILALGQSFFTLSLGQGTMVTYGSYLEKKSPLIRSCVAVVIMDTLAALLAAIVVFTIAFSVGVKPDSGPGLIFETLPLVFSQMPGGYLLAVLFFLLVFLAALSSEISALEPSIAYLIEERGWKRHHAVIGCAIAAFIVGVPSALSFSLFKGQTFFGLSILGIFEFATTSIMIPIGGFLAVYLVGWKWGFQRAWAALQEGDDGIAKSSLCKRYFWFGIKISAPILILLVFLHALM